jgi:hypothetical protein
MERGETRAKGLGTRVGCHSCVDKLLIRDSIKELVLSSSSSWHFDVLPSALKAECLCAHRSLNDVGARVSSWILDRLQISRCCYTQVDPNCLLSSPTVIIPLTRAQILVPFSILAFQPFITGCIYQPCHLPGAEEAGYVARPPSNLAAYQQHITKQTLRIARKLDTIVSA